MEPSGILLNRDNISHFKVTRTNSDLESGDPRNAMLAAEAAIPARDGKRMPVDGRNPNKAHSRDDQGILHEILAVRIFQEVQELRK